MFDYETADNVDKARSFLGDEFTTVDSIRDMSGAEWRTAEKGVLVLYVNTPTNWEELVYIYPDYDAWEIDITTAGRGYVEEPCCINNARNGFGHHDYDCPFA